MKATVRASGANKHITLNLRVSGLRVWRARWQLAIALIRIAAFVAGVRVHVDVARTSDDHVARDAR